MAITHGSLPVARIRNAIARFIAWLEHYGETSHDHQSFFASRLGGAAKALYYRRPWLGTLAVSPMIFCEAFVPRARRFFSRPLRFPIADAHYAMGFAFLAESTGEQTYYGRARHFLEALVASRCRQFERYAWGYPFDWQTRTGVLRAGTPMITTLPYVYEAFRQVYRLDKEERGREIMRSIADHALLDYRDIPTGPGAASCTYTPNADDRGGIVNASAYRAALLTRAAGDFDDPRYTAAAERNLNFVLASQNPDGSWPYSVDGERDFVDHFHTCFVLKHLAAIDAPPCGDAIARGVKYYVENLFDEQGLPKPFARRPRLTVYRRELYDYAECINLATLLRERFPELNDLLTRVLQDLLDCWQKPDGSFRARQLLLGWDNVPMHRWAQSQTFRSLCFVLSRERA